MRCHNSFKLQKTRKNGRYSSSRKTNWQLENKHHNNPKRRAKITVIIVLTIGCRYFSIYLNYEAQCVSERQKLEKAQTWKSVQPDTTWKSSNTGLWSRSSDCTSWITLVFFAQYLRVTQMAPSISLSLPPINPDTGVTRIDRDQTFLL